MLKAYAMALVLSTSTAAAADKAEDVAKKPAKADKVAEQKFKPRGVRW